MQIDRNEFIQELVLRENIRKAIKVVKKKRMNEKEKRILAESEIRKLVRRLIEEDGDDGPVPHQSTGINVLEELLKKIVPIIEIEYKQLTTDPKQRESFRAHIVNAIQNALAPTKAIKGDSEMAPGDVPEVPEEEDELAMEAIEMTVDDDPETGPGEADMDAISGASGDFAGDDQSQFIDITGGAEGSTDKFGIEGEEQTGRNFAEKTFEKVETQITDAYKLLSNDGDRELFYDYLVANMKLYFDKFEDELASVLPEPTNPEYEDEKGAEDDADAEGEEAAEEGGDELGGEEGGDEEELGGEEELTLQEGFGLGKQDLVNLGLDFNMVKGGYFDQIVIAAERTGPSTVAKSIQRALQRNPRLAKDPSGLLAAIGS